MILIFSPSPTHELSSNYRSVPQICPSFCNLNLSTKWRGDYKQNVTFSLVITPSFDRKMMSGSVDACFVLVMPFHYEDLEPDCRSFNKGGEWRPSMKHEVSLSVKREQWTSKQLCWCIFVFIVFVSWSEAVHLFYAIPKRIKKKFELRLTMCATVNQLKACLAIFWWSLFHASVLHCTKRPACSNNW